jgi:hypothetical protein
MEIKATSIYDRKACTALSRSLLGWRGPVNIVLFSLASLVVLVNWFLFDDPFYIGIFPLMLFGLIMTLMQYFWVPRATYQQLGDLQDVTNYFLFTDDLVQTYVKSPTYESRTKMQYSHFVKVKETKEYLFLFRRNRQAHIIDKRSLSADDLRTLRNRLRIAGIYDCNLLEN